jgi:hypothetical protein
VPSDKPFRVTWKAGQLVVHAATPQRAIEIAIEYLRVPGSGRLSAQFEATVISVQPLNN